MDTEQLAGSRLAKEYHKAAYRDPAYLTFMQSTSCEMPGWMNHKLESRLLGKISVSLGKAEGKRGRAEDEMFG